MHGIQQNSFSTRFRLQTLTFDPNSSSTLCSLVGLPCTRGFRLALKKRSSNFTLNESSKETCPGWAYVFCLESRRSINSQMDYRNSKSVLKTLPVESTWSSLAVPSLERLWSRERASGSQRPSGPSRACGLLTNLGLEDRLSFCWLYLLHKYVFWLFEKSLM